MHDAAVRKTAGGDRPSCVTISHRQIVTFSVTSLLVKRSARAHTSAMHSHPGPVVEHHADWAKIARLELELYGQTFHHVAPGCNCRECMKRRAE